MVQVTKQAVQQWMLQDYLVKQHRFQDTITQMERKYGMTLEEFEKHIETAEKEVFEEWDDNIEWTAAVSMLPDVLHSIEEIKQGAIEIIE
ncbi:hypothetical protein GCM10028805_27510 [Spirosoma harenae]